MPIAVLCPGCKARFTVADKFAGKKGPCPKCKAVITVPEVAAEEVKIHAPEEFASGGKDVAGHATTKPIARKEAKITVPSVAILAAVCLAVAVGAVALRFSGLNANLAILAAGLAVISPALTAAGYTFLRDAELEPYRGQALWIRAAICALVYCLLWATYIPLVQFEVLSGETWQWLFVAPVVMGLGGLAAFASFDIDYSNGVFHAVFYFLVTLLLRWMAGLPPVWTSV